MTDKEICINYRKEGLSLNKITKLVNKPKTTIYEWIKSVELSKEQKAKLKTCSYTGVKKSKEIRNKKKQENRNIGYNLAQTDADFRCLCYLYWAEGSKGGQTKLVNYDPTLLRVFLSLARKFSSHLLTLSIVYFNEENVKEVEEFWTNLLKPNKVLMYKKESIRDNHKWPMGGCTANLQKSGDFFQKLMGGIDYIKSAS